MAVEAPGPAIVPGKVFAFQGAWCVRGCEGGALKRPSEVKACRQKHYKDVHQVRLHTAMSGTVPATPLGPEYATPLMVSSSSA